MARYSARVPTSTGAHPASQKMGTGSLSWLGHRVAFPSLSGADVKARVELYFYSPSGPVLACNLPFFLSCFGRQPSSETPLNSMRRSSTTSCTLLIIREIGKKREI